MKILEKTKSVCPICMEDLKLNRIDANMIEEDGNLYLFKRCGKHGAFKDLLSKNPKQYLNLKKFDVEGDKSETSCESKLGCPLDCGICSEHKSVPLIVNIEVTNRCNLNCSYCYANYGKTGVLFEPTYEDVLKMIDNIAEYKPYKIPAIQFTGGEPTLHKHLPAMIAYAKEKGIKQIQIATNGIKLAQDPEFCKKLRKMGLKTIYLKFNGTTSKTNHENLSYMDDILKNCREAGFDSIVLVPTIIKGVNEQEIGAILKFGIANMDVIRGVNFQPVAFTGKMSKANLEKHRFTIDMLSKEIEEQTQGQIRETDIYPATVVAPISFLIEQLKNKKQPKFSMNSRCGSGTILYVSNGEIYPFPSFINIEKLFETINNEAKFLKKHNNVFAKAKSLFKLYMELNSCVDKKKKPKNFSFSKIMFNIFKKPNYDSLKEMMLNTFYIGTMHFQDCYNLDFNRLKKCVVGVAIPDGKIIPFCAYNNLGYRKVIEHKFQKNSGQSTKELKSEQGESK